MSTKEMIYNLDKKIDRLDEKVDGLVVAHAAMPGLYVTQTQLERNRSEAVAAKRWAITAAISSFGILVGGLAFIL